MIILLIIFIILLIFSAFFSSTETIFYLTEEKIKKEYIKVSYDSFLVFILLSNTIVNIFIGITAEEIFANHIFKDKSILISIALTTSILLFVGEIIPKRLALIIYPSVNRSFIYLMQKWIDLIRFFENIINFFISPIKNLNKEDKLFSIKEIKDVLFDGIKNGYFNPVQASLISNLISQSSSLVKDNIIHYTDLPKITNSSSLDDIFDAFKKTDLINLPVVSKNLKTVYGYVSKEDLLKVYLNDSDSKIYDIKNILHPLDMIYEFENIEFAIHRFIETNSTIFGVYDEYFQYCGVIDYYKLIDNILFSHSSILQNKFPITVNPLISCRSLYYNYNMQIKEEDFDLQLIDLILKNLGKFPQVGDYFIYQNYKFMISKIKGKKILSIIIDRVD